MNIGKQLCEAFCDGVSVVEIPTGFSVATAFDDGAGDRIAFYVIRDRESGKFRIEDDGSLVPTLTAMGSKVTEGQRSRVFNGILGSAGVAFDSESGELRTEWIDERDVPFAAMRFVTMLVRVAALWTMRADLVVSTFREDAVSRIKAELGAYASIVEREPVSASLSEFEPDLVVRAKDGIPVAVFVAVSDARLYEAIILRMAADHESHERCSVVAVLDKDGSRMTSRRIRESAHNRLDALPIFYGSESAAVALIGKRASIRERLQ